MQTRNFITICGAWFAIFFAGNATLFAAETVVESGERKISLASRFLGKLHPVSLQDQWEFIDIFGHSDGERYDSYISPCRTDFRYYFASREGRWYRISWNNPPQKLEIPEGYDLLMDLGQGWFLVREQAPGPGKRARSYLYNSLKKERLPRALDTSPQGYGGDGLIVAGIFHDENGRLEDSIEIIDLFSGEPIDFSNENCATARISEGIINLTISSPARNFSRLIDRNDREIFPLPKNVHAVGRFRNGVASCSVEGAPNGESAGMIDRMGRILCRGCESVYENSCGLSRAVKKSENGGQCVGYLNTLGEEAIPCRYSEGSDFFDESALVRRTDGRVFLINTFGDEILELEHLSEYPGLLDSLWKTGVYQRGDKENCSVYNIDGEKIWETSDPKEYEALADRFTAAAP